MCKAFGLLGSRGRSPSSFKPRHCEDCELAKQDEATQQAVAGLRLGCFVLLRKLAVLAMTVLCMCSDGFQPLDSNDNGWKPSLL